MIVRIATEGQYELADGNKAEFEQLDNEAVAAAEAGDEEPFQHAFTRLLEFVRTNGQPTGDDDLRGSDLILPPPDVSVTEAAADFSGEGLIPG